MKIAIGNVFAVRDFQTGKIICDNEGHEIHYEIAKIVNGIVDCFRYSLTTEEELLQFSVKEINYMKRKNWLVTILERNYYVPTTKVQQKKKNCYYKAIATLTDGIKEWDVILYSFYETLEEAEDDIKRYTKKGYNIVKTRIETWYE